ncbi:hypothetical protein M0811_07715 [Anaeramoeba ignava]|uniref:Uncharacterized protein n=1 Tax=Anaeramoeba ignava TaxID=1746090 RepID=A0A9Q0RC59_ANAIG|nr:hypothetical protein M0811_07715 [Anaeramoeba ignava]
MEQICLDQKIKKILKEKKEYKENEIQIENLKVYQVLETFNSEEIQKISNVSILSKKRSKIIEMTIGEDLLFTLSDLGIGSIFDLKNPKNNLGFLNLRNDEIIRSIHFNKLNLSLITVSVFKEDEFSTLHCRTTYVEFFKRKKSNQGNLIFESESLKWPGFVEFDDLNSKILTYCSQKLEYKIWNLKNYQCLYILNDAKIQEVKITLGIILLIFPQKSNRIKVKLIEIESGNEFWNRKIELKRNRGIEFIEQFNEKILIKQEREKLRILEIKTGKEKIIEKEIFPTPNAFIFLYYSQMILVFSSGKISLWSWNGKKIHNFGKVMNEDQKRNQLFISKNQEFLFCYVEDDLFQSGSLKMFDLNCFKSSTLTFDNSLSISCLIGNGIGNERKKIEISNPLEGISCIYYDQEKIRFLSGNSQGLVYLWDF